MRPNLNRSMRVTLTTASQAFPIPGIGPVSFQNLGGGAVAFVAFGSSNQVVTANPAAQANNALVANESQLGGYPILANAPATTFQVPAGVTHFAAVGSAALDLIVSSMTQP